MARLIEGLGSELARDGGEGGIRTHGPLRDNGFRDRPNRPLSHLSPEPVRSARTSLEVAERVGYEVALRSLRDALPLGGQPPRAVASLRSPHERGTPLSESPFKSHPLKKSPRFALAERVGFEPTIQFPVYGTSNAAPSATRPPLLVLTRPPRVRQDGPFSRGLLDRRFDQTCRISNTVSLLFSRRRWKNLCSRSWLSCSITPPITSMR